jgi:hypothetical protein
MFAFAHTGCRAGGHPAFRIVASAATAQPDTEGAATEQPIGDQRPSLATGNGSRAHGDEAVETTRNLIFWTAGWTVKSASST